MSKKILRISAVLAALLVVVAVVFTVKRDRRVPFAGYSGRVTSVSDSFHKWPSRREQTTHWTIEGGRLWLLMDVIERNCPASDGWIWHGYLGRRVRESDGKEVEQIFVRVVSDGLYEVRHSRGYNVVDFARTWVATGGRAREVDMTVLRLNPHLRWWVQTVTPAPPSRFAAVGP
jgi:hypothetical protein